jgi:tellurite resistance protein
MHIEVAVDYFSSTITIKWSICMSLLFIIILVAIIVNALNQKDKSYKKISSIVNNKHNIYDVSLETYKFNELYNTDTLPNLQYYSKIDSIELFGYNISNSIFYTSNSSTACPFAININSIPNFSMDNVECLGYWPNYNNLSKIQKGRYIKWLYEGKPLIEDLGYVYIYYYGLEYRALVEKKDLKDILFEVINLVTTFEDLRYGYDFITFLILSINEFSQDEKFEILKFLKNNKQKYFYNPKYNSMLKKLTSDEQYKITFTPYQFLGNYEINNLSNRKNELLDYYIEKQILKLVDSDIYTVVSKKYTYHMAMRYFYQANNSILYDEICPSLKLKHLWNNDRKIIQEEVSKTVKKFDSSSKPLTELEILSYLPQSLRTEICIPNIDFLAEGIYSISEILNVLNFSSREKLTLRQSEMIANICEAIGYNIEPDSRNNKLSYKQNTKVNLYLNAQNNKNNNHDYVIAELFLDLGYKIALEDNELLPVEVDYINKFITKAFNLKEEDKIRLKKRSELIIHNKDINTNELIKNLISKLDAAGIDTVGKFLVAVAAADGIIKYSELKILQKIFKQLNLSEERLNLTISELISDSEDIVIVEKGTGVTKKGSKIPKYQEKVEDNTTLMLNVDKLNAIKINTSEIHSVLEEIFEESIENEEIETEVRDESDTIEKSKIKNNYLDSLINQLLEKETWTRNELLNIIQDKGLMLSSAIDEINEWAEENFGDFLVEEDDNTYIVNNDVKNLIENKE